MNKRGRHEMMMRARFKEINRIVQGIPASPDLTYLSEWEVTHESARSELANQIRAVLHNLPQNWTERGVKTKAKALFVKHCYHEICARWKAMSEKEQAVWIGYVENDVEYAVIRKEQAAADAAAVSGLEVGDYVKVLREASALNHVAKVGDLGRVTAVTHYLTDFPVTVDFGEGRIVRFGHFELKRIG